MKTIVAIGNQCFYELYFLGPKGNGATLILHHFVKQIGSNRKEICDLNTLCDKSYVSGSMIT